MKVSTKGYGGREIRETVQIQTNDKQRPGLSVTLRGRVEKVVDIQPSRAILTGKAGTPLEMRIQITPMDRFPLKILGVKAKTGSFIEFGMEDASSPEKTMYMLTVRNRKVEKGRYYDQILVETDHPDLGVISIPVLGNIQ